MPQVFISYRRQDSGGHAGRLYDGLVGEFGEAQVIMDIDAIELGLDFVKQINDFVAECDVLLAIIGPAWLTVTDEEGEARLGDPNDFVRLEIAAALRRDVRVVPVLVSGAQMPRREDLPEDLRALALRHGLEMSDSRWGYDVGRLIRALRQLDSRPESGKSAVPVEPLSPPRDPPAPGDRAKTEDAPASDPVVGTSDTGAEEARLTSSPPALKTARDYECDAGEPPHDEPMASDNPPALGLPSSLAVLLGIAGLALSASLALPWGRSFAPSSTSYNAFDLGLWGAPVLVVLGPAIAGMAAWGFLAIQRDDLPRLRQVALAGAVLALIAVIVAQVAFASAEVATPNPGGLGHEGGVGGRVALGVAMTALSLSALLAWLATSRLNASHAD